MMLLARLVSSFWNLVPIPSFSPVSIPVRLLHVLGRDVVSLPVPKYIRAALYLAPTTTASSWHNQ